MWMSNSKSIRFPAQKAPDRRFLLKFAASLLILTGRIIYIEVYDLPPMQTEIPVDYKNASISYYSSDIIVQMFIRF